MKPLKYLVGYPIEAIAQVESAIASNGLGEILLKKYPDTHKIHSDKQLYGYAMELKNRFMANTQPLARVRWDSKIQVIEQALG